VIFVTNYRHERPLETLRESPGQNSAKVITKNIVKFLPQALTPGLYGPYEPR
jgi:hypothetical protein